MDQIHQQISESVPWYKNWHERESHWLIHWLMLILVAVLAWFSVNGQIYKWAYQISNQEVRVTTITDQAILSLSPKTDTVKLGETFAVKIILNTDHGQIDGVDIYGLHYDPSILKVIDDLPKQNGTQIEPGTIIPYTAANIVDENTGTIKLGQVSAGGTSFNGTGTLATVHFKAIGVGNSYLKFDFRRGSTVDTNAAHHGRDKLTSVVDAIYTVVPK